MKKVNFFDVMVMLLSAVVFMCLICWNTSIMGFVISKSVAAYLAFVTYLKCGQWQDKFGLLSSIEE